MVKKKQNSGAKNFENKRKLKNFKTKPCKKLKIKKF